MGQTKSEAAIESSKAFDRESNRFMVYAAALVVVHLLNIAPTQLSALGATFTLSSPIILRGVIAVLVIHKLYALVLSGRYYYAYGADREHDVRLIRHVLNKHTKPGRPFKQRKLLARIESGVWMALFAPYAITMLIFILMATALAVYDVVEFATYCFEQAPGMEPLRDFLLIESAA